MVFLQRSRTTDAPSVISSTEEKCDLDHVWVVKDRTGLKEDATIIAGLPSLTFPPEAKQPGRALRNGAKCARMSPQAPAATVTRITSGALNLPYARSIKSSSGVTARIPQ
jgi:hypothetical protein